MRLVDLGLTYVKNNTTEFTAYGYFDKKVRNKELEPEITTFMTQYNVTDLNTDIGKLKCQERKTKKGLLKNFV